MPFAHSHLRSDACGIVFRRIEEVIRDIQDTRQPSHSANEVDPVDLPISVHGPARPPRKEQEEDDVLINLRKFRRIQLISNSIQGEMEGALPRRSSVLSNATSDDELREEFMSPQGQPTVPTLIEWEGAGESVYVTGTFAEWNRKFRLHRE